MFNFYVAFAGQDIVTTCRLKFKAPSLQTESTENEGPFENMSFSKKTVWRFQRKKQYKVFA